MRKGLKETIKGTIKFTLENREYMEYLRDNFKYLKGCPGEEPQAIE